MRILLVAGHGAGDPGACAGGYCEADLARELAGGIADRLGGKAEIFDCSKNLYRHLKNGGSLNFKDYQYILELHFNAGASTQKDLKSTGVELLLHPMADKTYTDELILSSLSELGFKNRGIKRRNDLQNMNIMKKKGVPYALLEVCFIDDPDDIQLYKANSKRVADAIADAISAGFGISGGKELETVNDIVWELAERGVITDKALWLNKLQTDTNAYWLARKCANKLRKI